MTTEQSTDDTGVQPRFSVDAVLTKIDSSEWVVKNRFINIDTDTITYQLTEKNDTDFTETELMTESQIEQSFKLNGEDKTTTTSESGNEEVAEQPEESVTGWFEALGNNIPVRKRRAAVEAGQEMGADITIDTHVVHKTANLIEEDKPEKAIEAAREKFDLTGAYRFLAAMCASTGESPGVAKAVQSQEG